MSCLVDLIKAVGVSTRIDRGSSWWGRRREMLDDGAESEGGVKLDGGVRVKAIDVGALGGYKLRGQVSVGQWRRINSSRRFGYIQKYP